MVTVWLNGNSVGHINEVALRWTWLVLEWVTVLGLTPGYGNLSRSNQPPRSTQPGHPLWVGGMSTGDSLLATTRKETASSA